MSSADILDENRNIALVGSPWSIVGAGRFNLDDGFGDILCTMRQEIKMVLRSPKARDALTPLVPRVDTSKKHPAGGPLENAQAMAAQESPTLTKP